MNEDFVDEVFKNTAEIAVMYDLFGESNWKKVIAFFHKLGLNVDQTTEFLRSKHVRWAVDSHGSYNENTLNGVEVIEEYFLEYPEYFTTEYADKLVESYRS